MEFKDRLKKLRQEKQISQQKLASAIYVSRSAIAKWENGLGLPNESSYQALLDYFGITIEDLPLNNDIEAISVTKNKKIHKLSAAVVLLCILAAALLTSVVMVSLLSPGSKIKSYDWEKLDALLAEIGEENNSYYPDGNLAQHGQMFNIYYNKDAEAETFVRLTKIYRDNADDYYQLTFEKHFYNMVEGKIVTVSYTCSFHYADDVVYNLELADVNYFTGDEESIDVFTQCTTYQVNEKKMEKGLFLSCILEPVTTLGSYDREFHLPGGDEMHIFEIMEFGFEKTTEFFESHCLPTPY